jgi:hypothetical protein
MSDYVIISDAAAPLDASPAAAGALGLAAAFAATGRRIVVLTQADPERAARQPGLARRLRMVSASVAGEPIEVPLYEGRASASGANLFVLAPPVASTGSRGRMAALLASAASSLARDGMLAPDLVVGWGETSATALGALASSRRLLMLPTGTAGDPLPPEELEALGEADDLGAGRSLLARGLMAADAVAVPSPSAAASLDRHPVFAARPSDQPVAVVRLGCDDPPHDPQSDPALAHHYSVDATAGKAENRRAVIRRLSLAVGQRTLLCVTPPLDEVPGGRAAGTLLSVLAQLAGLDAAVVVRAGRDRALAERAKVLAIEHPGKVAVIQPDAGNGAINERELLAAADVLVLTDANDLTGRGAGLALRYGVLPVAPDSGASGDFLVDYDPASGTGNALLYAPGDSFELLGALRRGLALRLHGERWAPLVSALMRSAPRWSSAAAAIESLVEVSAAETPAVLAG